MNNKIFDINHNKLVIWTTPERIQKPRITEWYQSLIKPVVTLYQAFRRYREAKDYQLSITPQVCYLEKLLNDRYDYTLRRIYIEDSIDKLPTYIFVEAELKPVYLGSKTIYTNAEVGFAPNDFIIHVPLALQFTFEEPEMLSLVKAYKLAGMTPKIKYV